ncbi:MAG: transcription termination factor NusA [Candidatus Promineifilaceae bacterium]
MKSQFLIAFQEICRDKNLAPDTVLDALKTALVSAYRRNSSVSSSQEISADIDPRTGEMAVFAEKEVTDLDSTHKWFDTRTMVTLQEAKLQKPDAEIGDMVMADSTPQNFGRIAAQTAKQVILQRVREAERDQLFDEFSGREDEIVNGTVQSTTGGNLTIGLGRTEAILPRSQQVQGERYRAHDKIRVYILEVRRTSRGPQIFVSRSHRNLLRRLLELEVPEIYNGQVDIKSIAREAGARSKVAVQAMQPGVDPVGACVGMRGVRIQSIVRELSDEKIDVIEWDEDPKNFIAKALSPARVAQVFLDDDPTNGRTATVIVPDDQLSLAIGREGQNARLAAKLTGWRIDIKSLTEAGRDSLSLLDNPAADPTIARDTALHRMVLDVIAKKEAGRPITAEDYGYINRLVVGVEGRIIASRAQGNFVLRREKAEIRRSIPEVFWEKDLEDLNLIVRIHNLLLSNGLKSVGDVAFQFESEPEALSALDGMDKDGMANIQERLDVLHREVRQEEDPTEEIVLGIADEESSSILDAVLGEGAEIELISAEGDDDGFDFAELAGVVDATNAGEIDDLFNLDLDGDALFAIDEDIISSDSDILSAAVAAVAETQPEPKVKETSKKARKKKARAPRPIPVVEKPAPKKEPAPKPVEKESAIDILDDLSQSLVSIVEETRDQIDPQQPEVRIVRGRKDDSGGKKRTKGRQLVFDDGAGRVVAKRKRTQRGSQGDWGSDDE